MQRLVADPDERVQASALRGVSKKPTVPLAGKMLAPAIRRILTLSSVVIFGCAMVLMLGEGGMDKWRNRMWQGAEEFISALSWKSGLVVETINITGNNIVASEVLSDAMGITMGTPMALADLGGALDGLINLEWIRSAEVSRRWPSQIIVTVHERVPIAVWETFDGRVLIDKRGLSFGDSHINSFSVLPVIKGAGAPAEFPKLVAILEKKPFVKSNVVGAALIGERRWNLKVGKNLLVRLPEGNLEEAWGTFARHFEGNHLSLVGAVVADYTLPDRLVLQLEVNLMSETGDNLVDGLSSEGGIRIELGHARWDLGPRERG